MGQSLPTSSLPVGGRIEGGEDLHAATPSKDMVDIIKNPINKNPIYENAGKCNLHSSCPIPCGVIKAAEVELELALKKMSNQNWCFNMTPKW
jgi:hypothetical protein